MQTRSGLILKPSTPFRDCDGSTERYNSYFKNKCLYCGYEFNSMVNLNYCSSECARFKLSRTSYALIGRYGDECHTGRKACANCSKRYRHFELECIGCVQFPWAKQPCEHIAQCRFGNLRMCANCSVRPFNGVENCAYTPHCPFEDRRMCANCSVRPFTNQTSCVSIAY